jgi:hypothetical protein
MTAPDQPRDSTQTTIRNGPTIGQLLGVIVVLANFGLMFATLFVLKQKLAMTDVWLHGGAFVLAGYLLYPNKFLTLVNEVKDKIPTIGGGR